MDIDDFSITKKLPCKELSKGCNCRSQVLFLHRTTMGRANRKGQENTQVSSRQNPKASVQSTAAGNDVFLISEVGAICRELIQRDSN